MKISSRKVRRVERFRISHAACVAAILVHCGNQPYLTDEAAILQEVDRKVGANRFLLLGESAHGTGDFLVLRRRLLQRAVEDHGFTVLAIEASWSRAQALDRYVRDGDGDPVSAIHELGFWMWDNAEFLDTVQWMRKYNASHGAGVKLGIVGMDAQLPARSAEAVIAYLQRAAPGLYAKYAADLEEIRRDGDTGGGNRFQRQTADELAARTTDLVNDLHSLPGNAAPLVDGRALQRYARLFAARLHGQGEAMREILLAETVLDAAQIAKVVVWAHNEHVNKTPGHLGALLATHGGAAAIGLTFIEGSFLAYDRAARGPRPYTAAPPPKDAIEHEIAAATRAPLVALDPQSPRAAPLLTKAPRARVIGAQYNEWSEFQRVDLRAFDLLMALRRVKPPTPIPGRP